MLDLILFYPLVWLGNLLRKSLTHAKWTYMLMGLGWVQPIIRRMGIIRAYQVYNSARRKCPAYKNFLESNKHVRLKFGQPLRYLPITDKENYVHAYSIEERCYGGVIPRAGVVIDESSGSSGTPNNWIRGPEDRSDIKKLLQFTFLLTYPKTQVFLINCFALGPWATGMNVSMSLVDVAVIKSIGPDLQKLENTLLAFGSSYQYLIVGYPPFIRNFLEQTKLDLKAYKLWLVTGGEGVSEGLRNHFLGVFQSVMSSYGASDLDINIGVETELTVRLRRLCSKNPELNKALFGHDRVPMIFQYNPLEYYIETTSEGHLLFTVNRLQSAAPKVRYNLKDLGGTQTYKDLLRILHESGAELELPKRYACLPLLYVYGRDDTAVPFYGCKVLSSDIDRILYDNPTLSEHFNSFKFASIEDEAFNHKLKIILECRISSISEKFDKDKLSQLSELFYAELKRINQDFREVSKLFSQSSIVIEVHEHQAGPFLNEDIRIKLNYVQKSQ